MPLPPDKRRSKHFTLTVTREEKQDGIYSKFQVKRIYICIQQEEVVVGYVVNLKYSSVGYVVTLNYSSVGYIVILKYSSIGYIVTLKYSSVGYLVALKNSSAGYVVTLKYSSVGYVVTLKHSSLGYIATLKQMRVRVCLTVGVDFTERIPKGRLLFQTGGPANVYFLMALPNMLNVELIYTGTLLLGGLIEAVAKGVGK